MPSIIRELKNHIAMEAAPVSIANRNIYDTIKNLSRKEAEIAKAQGIDETRKVVQRFIGRKYKETSDSSVKSLLHELAVELNLV